MQAQESITSTQLIFDNCHWKKPNARKPVQWMRVYLLFFNNNLFTRNDLQKHAETFMKTPEIVFLQSLEKFWHPGDPPISTASPLHPILREDCILCCTASALPLCVVSLLLCVPPALSLTVVDTLLFLHPETLPLKSNSSPGVSTFLRLLSIFPVYLQLSLKFSFILFLLRYQWSWSNF